jgi:arylsulfatase A-like enzyme
MDIAPTIADMLMLEEGGPFEGNSLMAELLTAHVDPQRVLFHEFYLPERLFHGFDALELVSVRQDRYNLILDRVRGTYELYDWTADYFEQRDLYEELSRSPDVLRWKSVLGAFVEHFDRQVRPPQSDSGL